MRPLKIYIETSVFGFALDELEHNRDKREKTLLFLKQADEGLFKAYVSEPVIRELLQSPDIATRDQLVEMAVKYPLLREHRIEEAQTLTDFYMEKQAFPKEKRDDAVHVALMVINPEVDAMATWNCRHLANENNRRYLKALTLTAGYSFSFDIVTPEEAIIYERR